MSVSVFGVCAFAAANGDINSDKSIDASDARKILRAAVGLDKLSSEQFIAADIDMDGSVTASDARLALRIAVDLEKTDGKLYKNELEVLRSGFFFVDMNITEGGVMQNVKMAVTDKSSYISMNLNVSDILGDDLEFDLPENMNLSFLFNEDETYFIDDNNLIYAPMSALFDFAGGDFTEDDLGGSFADTDIGLIPDLSEANKVSKEKFNGVNCDKYTFSFSDGSKTNVYMNGKKLVGMVSENANGEEEVKYEFNSITLAVPSVYTAPPSAYKEVDPFEMLASMLFGGDFSDFLG